MPSVWRIVKTLPISAVSFPLSSSIMNRRPVPEVRASAFCVTPRPLRVSRTSLPMSCGVYFKSLTPFKKVTVREYYSVSLAKIKVILPYGNISYHEPSRRLECSRTGTKHVPDLQLQVIIVNGQSLIGAPTNPSRAAVTYLGFHGESSFT